MQGNNDIFLSSDSETKKGRRKRRGKKKVVAVRIEEVDGRS